MTKTEKQIVALLECGHRIYDPVYGNTIWIVRASDLGRQSYKMKPVRFIRRSTLRLMIDGGHIKVGCGPDESRSRYMTAREFNAIHQR